MREQRGPWYLITGLLIGLAAGILYSWLADPVEFLDTNPASLHPDFRAEYRSLIALAYEANGDIGRARMRLALLRDEYPAAELEAQAGRAQKTGRPFREVEALAKLSSDLQQYQAVALTPSTMQETPLPVEGELNLEPTATPEFDQMVQTPTPTPRVTFTARPTQTLRAILSAPFTLSDRQPLCNPDLTPALLQIEALDSSGKPVPGVRAVMTWEGGENVFFTGLNPRISPGYADFVMEPGVVYSLRVGEGGDPVSDLTPQKCQVAEETAEGGMTGTPPAANYWGGWRLRFVQQ